MDLKRNFALERTSRIIDGCEDPAEVKRIAISLLRLYLGQQEVVEGLLKEGRLSTD